MKKSTLKIGDKVAYSKKFLQNIADYSYASASRRGTITKLDSYGGGDFVLASVDGDFNIKVNVNNLVLVKNIQYEI